MQNNSNSRTNIKKINILLLILAAVFVFVTAILLVSTMMKYNDRLEEKAKLEAQKKAMEEQVEEKYHQLDTPLDEEHIADIARDKLNMYYPDEIVYYNDNFDSHTETAQ